MRDFDIYKLRGQLVLEKSKRSHLREAALLLVILAFVYSFGLFAGEESLAKRFAHDPFLTLFLLIIFPLVLAPVFWRDVKIVVFGEVFVFDRGRGNLLKDGSEVCPLGHVDHVGILSWESEDGQVGYRLSVILLDRKKIEIDNSSDKEEIVSAAREIADYVGVKVVEN